MNYRDKFLEQGVTLEEGKGQAITVFGGVCHRGPATAGREHHEQESKCNYPSSDPTLRQTPNPLGFPIFR